jgi:hypothetical protein
VDPPDDLQTNPWKIPEIPKIFPKLDFNDFSQEKHPEIGGSTR